VEEQKPSPAVGALKNRRLERARKRAAFIRQATEAALDPKSEERLDFLQLLRLYPRPVADEGVLDEAELPLQEVADEFFDRAHAEFKRQYPDSQLGLFQVGGAFLAGDGSRLRIGWFFQKVAFDSSEARALVDRIDAIGDGALSYWPDARAAEQPFEGRIAQALKQVRRVWRRAIGGPVRSPGVDRQPHLNRAYELATSVLATVTNEAERHESAAREGSPPNPDSVSERYRHDLANIRARLERAERLLEIAGQHAAQARYGRGMFWGSLALAFLTLATAAVFYATETEAAYGVALPAGGLGAVVSVLQRMSSHRFRLELESTSNLAVFGGVRPFVGAVFGFLVVALLESDLLSIAPAETSKLALFAALAFFAGFNERFAQDALSSSVSPMMPTDDSRAE
jgi:hypothetical protein